MPTWAPVAPASKLMSVCPGPRDEFLSFLIVIGLKNHANICKKFQSQTFWLQVILGPHFIGCCFGKSIFAFAFLEAPPKLAILTPMLHSECTLWVYTESKFESRLCCVSLGKLLLLPVPASIFCGMGIIVPIS